MNNKKTEYKLRSNSSTLDLFGRNIAYLVSREVKEGKLKLTFLGSDTQIKRVLGKLERFGVHFRIVSLTEAKLSSDSPLNALTEKQRKVITTAYNMGYYNIPRKINSGELAKNLSLHKSALVDHRRKAELRILTKILKG